MASLCLIEWLSYVHSAATMRFVAALCGGSPPQSAQSVRDDLETTRTCLEQSDYIVTSQCLAGMGCDWKDFTWNCLVAQGSNKSHATLHCQCLGCWCTKLSWPESNQNEPTIEVQRKPIRSFLLHPETRRGIERKGRTGTRLMTIIIPWPVSEAATLLDK